MAEKQIARTLTNPQRDEALRILQFVLVEIDRYADGNEDLAFRMRRFVHARVQLKNRGTVPEREKLRRTIFEKQQGLCVACGEPIDVSGSHIHRTDSNRYTVENTVLMHEKCHEEHHRREGGTAENEDAVQLVQSKGPASAALPDSAARLAVGSTEPVAHPASRYQLDSLRGRVQHKFKISGEASWDIDQLVRALEEADDELADEGLDPAPTIRASRLRGDRKHMVAYAKFWKFPWLRK